MVAGLFRGWRMGLNRVDFVEWRIFEGYVVLNFVFFDDFIA